MLNGHNVNRDCQPLQSTKPKHPTGNNRGLQQAYDIRDFTAELIARLKADQQAEDGSPLVRRDEYGKPVDAAAVSQLVKAWSEACDRIRILRNRPLPGSLKPTEQSKPKKAKAPVGPIGLAPKPPAE